MKNSVIYIVGATVLVGGAYLFLKNKKAKDLAELDTLGGTTPSGTTSGGTTPSGTTPPLSTATDGVAPSDSNINLANATVLVGQRAIASNNARATCYETPHGGGMGSGRIDFEYQSCLDRRSSYKALVVIYTEKIASLGYKTDATGKLVKI